MCTLNSANQNVALARAKAPEFLPFREDTELFQLPLLWGSVVIAHRPRSFLEDPFVLAEDFRYSLKIKSKAELKPCPEGVLSIFPAYTIVP